MKIKWEGEENKPDGEENKRDGEENKRDGKGKRTRVELGEKEWERKN